MDEVDPSARSPRARKGAAKRAVPPQDDTPLARLRQAAAELAAEEGRGGWDGRPAGRSGPPPVEPAGPARPARHARPTRRAEERAEPYGPARPARAPGRAEEPAEPDGGAGPARPRRARPATAVEPVEPDGPGGPARGSRRAGAEPDGADGPARLRREVGTGQTDGLARRARPRGAAGPASGVPTGRAGGGEAEARAEPAAAARERSRPAAPTREPDSVGGRQAAPVGPSGYEPRSTVPAEGPAAAPPPPPEQTLAARPSWAAPTQAYPPPPGPAFHPELAQMKRAQWPVVVGIVAVLLVVVLVVAALMAASPDDGGSDDESGTAASALADRPVIPPETLYSVPGHTFSDLPAGSLEVARSPFDSRPELKGMLTHLSGRTVVGSEGAFAAALVYQFSTRFTSVPGYADGFFQGVTGVASESEEITVAGNQGVYYRVGNSLTGVVVLKGNVAVLVQSPPPTQRSRLEQVAAGLLGNVP